MHKQISERGCIQTIKNVQFAETKWLYDINWSLPLATRHES